MISLQRKLVASLAKHAHIASHISRQDTLRSLKNDLNTVKELLLSARVNGSTSLHKYEEQVFRIKKIIEEKENNW